MAQDISIKAAIILAIIIESILYGISTFLFGITLWSLTYQRNSAEVARLMIVAACLLFLLGTMHVIVDANHVWQGFIASENVDKFFQDISKNTLKNAIYELETLVGDAILIYRCYVVWQRIEVIIIPMIGWIAIAVTGAHTVWSISQLSSNPEAVFERKMGKWLISFYATEIFTNLLTTSILAFKLWSVHQGTSRIRATKSPIYPTLIVIMECGALYSMSLLTMLVTCLTASNSAYIVVDMIGQIIPITFCLVITRTAMLRFGDRTSQGLFSRTGTSDRLSVPRRPLKVHINRMTMIDTNVGRESGVSSPHTDAAEGTYHSKVHGSRG
ncbi:hypothetical protein K503DRAFT_798973 [Rhizopogon vinicolor AM-OR11-026]|uniref:Family A G protein-coupled receptor-like protein n=1 Tax=Rhizopogon vinicolor AM-OR11-026 TaxID=1314800 RepID=A0A1B7N5W7_9AGAM|nr:hypothetical protein K503DRAFT_798973 [Rhizopogon vinicolor AM-OR11-026]